MPDLPNKRLKKQAMSWLLTNMDRRRPRRLSNLKYTKSNFTVVEKRDADIFEVNNVANGVQLERLTSGSGIDSGGFLQTFIGLGGGQTNNFTISTEIKLIDYKVNNNQRVGGIHMFANSATNNSINDHGISAHLIGGDDDNGQLQLSTGLNGSVLAGVDWGGVDFADNDEFSLSVIGSFSGSDFNPDFTVSRLNGD